MLIIVVLLLAAAVCFAIAAFGVNSNRINLVAAGLCLVAIAFLLPQLGVR